MINSVSSIHLFRAGILYSNAGGIQERKDLHYCHSTGVYFMHHFKTIKKKLCFYESYLKLLNNQMINSRNQFCRNLDKEHKNKLTKLIYLNFSHREGWEGFSQ